MFGEIMISLVNANSLRIPLADKSVQCCVTSPPYWGLRDLALQADGWYLWKGEERGKRKDVNVEGLPLFGGCDG